MNYFIKILIDLRFNKGHIDYNTGNVVYQLNAKLVLKVI